MRSTTVISISNRIAAEAIIKSVAEEAGLTPTCLTGKRRHPKIARARHKAMFLVRETLSLSYPELGTIFNRDHSTVIYAVNHYRAFHLPKSLGLPVKESSADNSGTATESAAGVPLH